MFNKRVLIIVPAFNESGGIKKLIQEIQELAGSADILVVDDGSTDTTASEVRDTQSLLVTLPYNLGIGGAVQTGFKYALKCDYDIAVQVDGDGQHDVNYLKDIIAPIGEDAVDVVIGSRFVEEGSAGYRSSFVRRIGIRFFAWLLSGLTRQPVTDPTSGFRAYNKKAVAVFAEYYPSDFPEPESIMIAKRNGLRVMEVPVKMRERTTGQSSIRYLKTLYYMIKVTFAILLDIIKTKKEKT